MIAGLTYYQICWYFIIYSCIGWGVEVIYHAVSQGRVLNRGFLNGPVCPVYGFGMLAVLAAGNCLEEGGDVTQLSAGVIFLGGMLLATAVELIAGWTLDTFCHARWWDYSQVPFNFHGYICLKFSIYWGLGAIIVVQVVHPLIAASPAWHIPETIGWIVLAFLYAVYVTDFCATAATVRGLNRRLARLDELNRQMRRFSDAVSEELGTNSLKAAQKIGESRVQASLARMELRDLAEEKTTEARASMAACRNALDDLKNEALTALDARRDAAQVGAPSGEVPASAQVPFQNEAEAGSRETYQKYRAQYEALRAQILDHSHFGSGRFLRSFPDFRHHDYEEVMEELRQTADGK